MQDKTIFEDGIFETKSTHDFVQREKFSVTLITSVIIVVLIMNPPVRRQKSLNDDANEDA